MGSFKNFKSSNGKTKLTILHDPNTGGIKIKIPWLNKKPLLSLSKNEIKILIVYLLRFI